MMTERETRLLDGDAGRLWLMYGKGQHALLLHEVDEIAKAGPLSAGVLGVAALACVALERYDEAADSAQMALEHEPNWAWLYHAFAAAQAGRRDLPKAVAAATKAVRLASGEPVYAATLARYQRLNGQPGDAIKTARQALVVHPDDPGNLNELGLALLAEGDYAGSLSQFRAAQTAAPDQADGYLNEGVLHLRAGARKEARHSLREALHRQPGYFEAEDLMAHALAGGAGIGRTALRHLLTLGRITIMGWAIIAFMYYLVFRLLQLLWQLWPGLLPAARGLLLATLVYLVGGLVLGRALRLAFGLGRRRVSARHPGTGS